MAKGLSSQQAGQQPLSDLQVVAVETGRRLGDVAELVRQLLLHDGSQMQACCSHWSEQRLWAGQGEELQGGCWPAYLEEAEVQAQRRHVAHLPAAADVAQLQLQVVPAAVCHLHLVQLQAHGPRGAAPWRRVPSRALVLNTRPRYQGVEMVTSFFRSHQRALFPRNRGHWQEKVSQLTLHVPPFWQGDEAGQVQGLAVHVEVLHAADELPRAEREVVRHVGDPAEEQGARQPRRSPSGEAQGPSGEKVAVVSVDDCDTAVSLRFGPQLGNYSCAAQGQQSSSKKASGSSTEQEEESSQAHSKRIQVLPFDDNVCLREPCQNYMKCISVLRFNSSAPFISSPSILFRPIHPIAGLRCRCPAGFTGDYCETEINLCYSNPCLNGGVCARTEGGFTCICREDYTEGGEGGLSELPLHASGSVSDI
ncbi:hypothetical protein CRUP_032046 [Coryphaenoides rupestris]|nr:hypothetical protein CRUP_032046 [Coryphaenoides rupestris]